jgi:hypothetical protein
LLCNPIKDGLAHCEYCRLQRALEIVAGLVCGSYSAQTAMHYRLLIPIV